MGSTLGLSEVNSFFQLAVWKTIATRLHNRLAVLDHEIEENDVFKHGKAVGERQAIRLVLAMSDILTTEAQGKSPYGTDKT